MIETNKIYLIRHAPVKKLEGYVPKNDPNAIINPDHFKILASHIPDNSICYVSPLKRAIQTARQLSKFIKLREIIIEKDLREQNFGDWEGKKISVVWEELKKFKIQHNFSFICPEVCPPNGDSFIDQCDRVAKFINNLNFHDQGSLVVIAHSGTIRAFLSLILDIDHNKAISIEISHLSITSIEVLKKENCKNKGGRYRLLNINNQVI